MKPSICGVRVGKGVGLVIVKPHKGPQRINTNPLRSLEARERAAVRGDFSLPAFARQKKGETGSVIKGGERKGGKTRREEVKGEVRQRGTILVVTSRCRMVDTGYYVLSEHASTQQLNSSKS